MAELVAGFLTSAFLCGIGVLLIKRCNEFEDRIKDETEYILITKEQYETMKNNPDVKKIIFEQPQMDEPELPSYSESDRLVLIKAEKFNAAPQRLNTTTQNMIDF